MGKIRKILKYLFYGPKAVARWMRALDLTSKEDYSGALHELDNISFSYDNNPEYFILRGFLFFALNKSEDCITNLNKGLIILEKTGHYSLNDNRYLKCYANDCYALMLERMGKTEESQRYFSLCDCNSIVLNDVNNSLKLNFPLRRHPDWPKEKVSDNFDIERLREESLILYKLLVEYSKKEANAKLCLEALKPIFEEIMSGKVSKPYEDIPCGYYFHEGALRCYEDLEDAYSTFSVSARGGDRQAYGEFFKSIENE